MSRSEVTLQFGVLGFASLNAVDFDLDDLVNIAIQRAFSVRVKLLNELGVVQPNHFRLDDRYGFLRSTAADDRDE